jgi:hypothetical protein
MIIDSAPTTAPAGQRGGHGHFLSWLEAEFRWSERSAQNYMAVAGLPNAQVLADLPITREALYLLAGPSVPEEVRTEATTARLCKSDGT